MGFFKKGLTPLDSIIFLLYSGPPLMRPTLGNENSGRIRGVAAGEGLYISIKGLFSKSRKCAFTGRTKTCVPNGGKLKCVRWGQVELLINLYKDRHR